MQALFCIFGTINDNMKLIFYITGCILYAFPILKWSDGPCMPSSLNAEISIITWAGTNNFLMNREVCFEWNEEANSL